MGIENCVTRVTVWHHEACQVTPNSYPEWQKFQSPSHNHYGFVFLHTFPLKIAFKHKNALFYLFNAKISISAIKKCMVRLLSMPLKIRRNWCQNDILTSCTRVVQDNISYHWCYAEIPIRYARKISYCTCIFISVFFIFATSLILSNVIMQFSICLIIEWNMDQQWC